MNIMANGTGAAASSPCGPAGICDMDRMKIAPLNLFSVFDVFAEPRSGAGDFGFQHRSFMALETQGVGIGLGIPFNVLTIGTQGILGIEEPDKLAGVRLVAFIAFQTHPRMRTGAGIDLVFDTWDIAGSTFDVAIMAIEAAHVRLEQVLIISCMRRVATPATFLTIDRTMNRGRISRHGIRSDFIIVTTGAKSLTRVFQKLGFSIMRVMAIDAALFHFHGFMDPRAIGREI